MKACFLSAANFRVRVRVSCVPTAEMLPVVEVLDVEGCKFTLF